MVATPLPPDVVHALRGQPVIGADESAAQFVTVRADGFPHITLLSRAELDVADGRLLVALAGSTTPGNLERSGQATLVVVVDDTVHSCDLRVQRRHQGEGMVAYAMEMTGHRADSLGIPLTAIRYTTPPELPSVERWETSARLLAELGRQL